MLKDTIVIIASHSGGTFASLAVSNLLQAFTKKIFVVTSEFDTQVNPPFCLWIDPDLRFDPISLTQSALFFVIGCSTFCYNFCVIGRLASSCEKCTTCPQHSVCSPSFSQPTWECVLPSLAQSQWWQRISSSHRFFWPSCARYVASPISSKAWQPWKVYVQEPVSIFFFADTSQRTWACRWWSIHSRRLLPARRK